MKTYGFLTIILTSMGYKKVRRCAGGISDWEDAGYPLEGSFVV